MTTHTTLRPGTTQRIGSGRPAVVRVACAGDVVRDVRLAASLDAPRARAASYERNRQWIELGKFGGRRPRHQIGAEPAAGRRTQ